MARAIGDHLDGPGRTMKRQRRREVGMKVAAIVLAWPLELIWVSMPIAWLVCLAISYGWVKAGIWKRLEI